MEQNTDFVAPVTPPVDESKQKNGNGLKIATLIACIVAVCGIGFGVYSTLENNNKSQEISNLKKQIELQNETIAKLSEQKMVGITGLEPVTLRM